MSGGSSRQSYSSYEEDAGENGEEAYTPQKRSLGSATSTPRRLPSKPNSPFTPASISFSQKGSPASGASSARALTKSERIALGLKPEVKSNAQRPAWSGPVTGPQHGDRTGKLDLPIVGKEARTASRQTELAYGDDHDFLTSLRVEPAHLGEAEEPASADKAWWRPNSRGGMRAEAPEEDLPAVFERLTNARAYPSTHKHRFEKDGSGKGISGRRDSQDEEEKRILNGHGVILRDLKEDQRKQRALGSQSGASSPSKTPSRPNTPGSSERRRSSTGDGPDVFSRLSKPSNRQMRKEDVYDAKQKVLREEFNVVRDAIPKWQSGI